MKKLKWVITPFGDNLFKICQRWEGDGFWFEENEFNGTIVECKFWKNLNDKSKKKIKINKYGKTNTNNNRR